MAGGAAAAWPGGRHVEGEGGEAEESRWDVEELEESGAERGEAGREGAEGGARGAGRGAEGAGRDAEDAGGGGGGGSGAKEPNKGAAARAAAAQAGGAAGGRLTVTEYNVGGLATHEQHFADVVARCGAHLVLVTETHLRAHNTLSAMERRWGWRIINVARTATRKKDGKLSMAKGGVALVCTNPKGYAVTAHTRDPRGLLSAEVTARSGGLLPWLVVVVYLPPATSSLAKDRAPLLAKAQAVVAKAREVYGSRVILGGDFNMPLARLGGAPRHTHGAITNEKSGESLRKALEDTGLAPTVGRTAAHPAVANSRAVGSKEAPAPGKGAEVCFLCLPADAEYEHADPPAAERWSAEPGSSTHIPQTVRIVMPPRAQLGPPAQGAAHAPRRYEQPDYGNKKAWDEVAGALLHELRAVAPASCDPATSTVDAHRLVVAAMERALDSTLTEEGRNGQQRSVWTPPRPKGRRQVEREAAMERRNQADILRNRQLPPDVVAAIKEARRTGSKEHKRLAKKALKAHVRASDLETNWRLRRMQREAPKRFHDRLKRDLAPEEGELHEERAGIPHEDGKDGPMARFTAAFNTRHGPGAMQAEGPPALEDEEWLRHVRPEPLPPHAALARPFSARELVPAVYPDTDLRYHPCPATGSVGGGCPLCDAMRAAAWRWTGPSDLRADAPKYKPRMRAQAATNGHAQPVHLAWARPEQGPRLLHRLRIAGVLVSVLNKCLLEGRLPAEMAAHVAVPVLKKGNPADPDNYRFTVIEGLMHKLLDLAITARLTHHAARVGAVSAAHQGAFTAGMGTEWHVWAARETVADAWRRGQNVFMVFLDFEKAYDKVHPKLMLKVLERQGVPPKLLALMESWLAARTAGVRVNGETSAATPMPWGLPQGWSFAPMGFNYFENPLSMYLESKGHLGVTVGLGQNETNIISISFADDVNSPQRTWAAAQEVLRLVEEWCTAWGMKMNLGKTKTTWLPLICPEDRGKPEFENLPPVTLASGEEVHPCVEYKYLGSPFTRLMDADKVPVDAAKPQKKGKPPPRPPKLYNAALAAFVTHVREAFSRYYYYNSVAQLLAPAARLQLAKTTALGSYLLGTAPWTRETLSLIGRELRKQGTMLTGLGDNSPVELLAMQAGLGTATSLVARERWRLWLILKATRHQTAPAPRVFRACDGPGSWRHETERMFAKYERLGARKPQEIMGKAPGYEFKEHEVKVVAAVMGREYANVELAAARKKTKAGVPKYTLTYTMLSQPWATSGSVQTVLDLLLGFAHGGEGVRNLHRATSVSALGVGCSGWLWPKVTAVLPQAVERAVLTAWEGPLALCYPPLAPGGWRLAKTANAEARRQGNKGTLCPLCKGGVASPEHIANACTGTHGDLNMVLRRAELRAQARYLVARITRALLAAQGRDEGLAAAEVDAASIDFTTTTGKAALHRLLVVAPWPAASVDAPAEGAIRSLGALFDSTVVANHRLRRLANVWVPWAGRTLVRLCASWAAAVDDVQGWKAPAEVAQPEEAEEKE